METVCGWVIPPSPLLASNAHSMNRIGEWFELRTGAASAIKQFFFEEIPASTSWPQVFGSVALFLFLVQALTGMLLGLNYAGSPGDAYDSVIYIMRDVSGGRMIRGLHHWGASMMVIVVAVHAAQVFIYAAYKKPREVTWMSGVMLFLLVMSFGLTGYLLPWDNRAYWGTVVTTQIAGQVPWLGQFLQHAIGVERGIGVVAFSRFYALHVLILPAITISLIGVHVALVRKHGVTPGPLNTSAKRKFFPDQVFKDTLAVFVAFAIVFAAAVFVDAPLERLADPTDSSYVPRPEWYFLFLFQAIKLFHGPYEVLGSVGLPSAALAALLLVPVLDRHKETPAYRRKWAIALVAFAFVGWGSLTFAALEGSSSASVKSSVPVRHQRVLALTPDELAGFKYFRRENCQSCHNLLDGEPKVGPNLAGLENRRSPDWMESHFRQPSNEAPTATENRQPLSAAQMNALVTLASKLTPEKASDLSEAPDSILAGADIYVSNLCASCHKVNGAGGNVGPSLNGLAARRSRKWIEKHFQSPRVMTPGSIMPPYHFPANQEDQTASYLLQLP
jgi:ubiquinol-cytochrome c reductase cytochrome b subunit